MNILISLFGVPSVASACEPMVPLMMAVGGPGFSVGPFALPVAIAIKCLSFPFFQKGMKKTAAARVMLEGNICTSVLGVLAILPAAAPAAIFFTIWIILGLSYVPAKRLAELIETARWARMSPFFLAVMMTGLYFGSAVLIGVSTNAAADGQYLTYWAFKIFAMVLGVGFGIAFTSLWEEWVICKRVIAEGESNSFLVPVFRANGLAFLVIMSVFAGIALPKRMKDPNFLLQSFYPKPAFAVSITQGNATEPKLESGDIVFQTSTSNQSWAIMWASKSLFSHTGIVEVSDGKEYVIEAIARVSRTPFSAWKARGRLGRYAVYRIAGLDDAKQAQIVESAKKLLGRKYDIYFTSMNEEIYCSELVEMAYQGAGIRVGKFEKVKNLDVDNFVVRAIAKKRWKGHPVCKMGVATFDACWSRIREDELVTPISIAKDPRLTEIWSNYP